MADRELVNRPDPHMSWIYDTRHPEYNSPKAKRLREARATMLAKAPRWLLWDVR